MDPFTQRMLERARARREKLDTQLSNAGHDVKRRRSPLKDANAILAQAAVTKSKTPTKSPAKAIVENASPVKSPRKSIVKNVEQENHTQVDKENGEIGVHNVRSKLQRLGKLYSEDSSRELSSPIHRTEERFNAEEEDVEQKPSKRGARLDRLAALASTINNWEDDLSHPNLVKPPENKAKKIQEKFNEQVKGTSQMMEPQPSTSGCNKWNRNSRGNSKEKESVSAKQLKWDKAVLDNLEAQGFSRSKSNSRLVYDYKACSQESNAQAGSSSKQSRCNEGTVSKKIESSNAKKTDMTGNSKLVTESKNLISQSTTTPEKSSKNSNSGPSCTRLAPRFGYNGSPKSPAQSSPGSVLSKASMFESKNTESKAKDPAQMTLSERMALFERNKGEAPLIPKAPLTMSIPPKKLQEKDKSNSSPGHNDASTSKDRSKIDIPTKAVVAQRDRFEHGLSTHEMENDILRNTQIERQRELDMLRSRFNRNKEMAQAAAGSCIRTSESSEGKSTSPKNSPVCPVKPTPAPEQNPPPPPPPPPQVVEEKRHSSPSKSSPPKRQGDSASKTLKPKVSYDVKRIRVAPPKPGHLYPNLSDIECTTETETETEYTVNSTEAETATLDEKTDDETVTEAEYYVQDGEDGTELDSDDECDEVNTSLGRSILRAVNQHSFSKKKRSIDPDPDSTTSDISVLDEMDEYLDECLAIQEAHAKNIQREEGPTPPKVNKAGKSPSCPSTSFKYTHGPSYRSPIKAVSPPSAKKNEPYIVDGDNYVPLMHSVSFYRRQQSQTPKTPVRVISRTQDIPDSIDPTAYDSQDEATLVQEKVKRLLEEVCKQQTIIGQASQALNLCSSTIEFSGSREQVEGERLLLLATHRRQAALNEVQRLKVEGTLRPVVPGSPEVQESGSLTVSAITLPLRREVFRNMGTNTCLHFVCLMRHLEEIVATPVVVAEPGDSCLRFPSTLKLQDLYSDFKITIEVYSLQTQAEMLPHEIKYHIHNNGNGCSSSTSAANKKLGSRTPKKFLKQDSRLIMPTVQSPAGPSAVRSPAFQLSGYVIFSLKEVHRQQFTLNKVPPQSPLEGRLQMHVSCELSVSVEHRGFLTMFEDVSGFGAWHRRWCLLKGSTLSYWKYPDDERKKTPIGSLDLQGVSTTNVGLVSRDICARPNTFLLETTRSAQPGDTESLVLIRNGSETTIRHLLSADTKEDRLEWCSKLNKTLNLLHAWGGTSGFS